MRTSDISSHQRFRSANRHQLMVPRHRRSTFGRQAFSVAGAMEWTRFHANSGTLLGVLAASDQLWKLFSQRKGTISALEVLREALYKSTTTTTTHTNNHLAAVLSALVSDPLLLESSDSEAALIQGSPADVVSVFCRSRSQFIPWPSPPASNNTPNVTLPFTLQPG